MKSRQCAWLVLVGALFLCVFVVSAVSGQEKEDRYLDAVLDVMPDMADRFETVNEMIRDKKWERVFEKLNEIAEEASGTVWAVDKDKQVFVSVRDYIRRCIMLLPPEGLAFYRLRHDSEARALMEDGLAKQDVRLLDELDAKYPASSYALIALDAAASILIDRGSYGTAAERLSRLVASPRAAGESKPIQRLRAMALAKLAFCTAKLGDEDGAKDAVAALKKSGYAGRLNLGGATDVAAFVQVQLKGGPAASLFAPTAAWTLPAGSPAHDLPMLDVRANLSKRWEVKIGDDTKPKTSTDPRRRIVYYGHGQVSRQTQTSPIPVSDSEGVVYINTGRGLFALDHITGRQRWMARPLGAPTVKQSQPGVFAVPVSSRLLATTWPRWQGATSVSLGGGKVFAVEVRGENYQTFLSLSAFDQSSGKRRWSFEQRPDGAGFEGLGYFPWAPTYVEKQLVGLACYRDQMFLASLDPATGKLNWKVFLSADPVQATTVYGRRSLNPRFGQPVIAHDGVAYAATGMGVVAAVNIREGELLWISRYPRKHPQGAIKVIKQKQRLGGYTQYQQDGGWQGGFPVVSRGKLYVAAWDSNQLLAFDCRSGAITRRFQRGSFTHFVGAHKGDLILVGPETAAMSPHTGHLRWLVPTPFEVHGLPVLTESAVVIPTRGRTKVNRTSAMLCAIRLDGEGDRRVVRHLRPVRDVGTGLPLGNIVSCDGRLIAVNKGFATGSFAFDETRQHLVQQMKKNPKAAKPALDLGDLLFLHDKYAEALQRLQTAELILAAQRPADKALLSRLRRMMFETRLKLSQTDRRRTVEHIDAARKYIFNDVARGRFHLARGAALAAAARYVDAVDEYTVLIEKMETLRLEEDESSAPVGVIAQGRIGELVEKYGAAKVYARIDAVLRPQYEKLVAARNGAALRQMQLRHPHSSLADNCLLEVARIVEKEKFGLLKAQTLLRSVTLRYPRSEKLGEAYGRLLENCMTSSQYRLAAYTLKDIKEKHPSVVVPWKGKGVKGSALVALLMQKEEFKQASLALSRVLPQLLPPLRKSWQVGKGAEMLVKVVSDDNCFDRGIGLAVDVTPGPQPYQYYGKINRVRAFDTGTGQTLWQTNVKIAWCYGDIESGISPWTRGKYRAIALCSGSIIGLCHPEGIVALDLATGQQVWQAKWKRPPSRNPMQWFDHNKLRVHHQLRQAINQRPVFAAEAGRIFYCKPDGDLACIDAATGKDIWRTKRKGYTCGPIGIFGDVVVVASVIPNKITAYSALSGKALYTKDLPGTYPSHPSFDRTRNRILLNDNGAVHCHAAADFKRLWKGSHGTAQVRTSQPWCTEVLPGNRIAVTGYSRAGTRYGYGVVMYNGDTGKRVWAYNVTNYKRNGQNYTNTSMCYAPAFSRRVAFIPAQTYKTIRQGRKFTQERRVDIHIVDIQTGKKLRQFTIKPSGAAARYGIGFMSSMPTAEHAAFVTRQYEKNRYVAKLYLVSGETGKAVFSESLPFAFTTGRYQYLLQQRFDTMATVEGSLLVPSGRGISGYGSAGVGTRTPAPKKKAGPNEKKK